MSTKKKPPVTEVLNPDTTTLAQAIAFVLNHRKDGVTCPCCGQKARVYKKPLIGTAVADLIRLVVQYLKSGNQDVHISKFTKQRSNIYTLQYWKLITKVVEEAGEEVVGPDGEKKRSSGMWRPTEKGIAFITEGLRVPRYAVTYDNKLIELTGDKIGVREALGKKFDFDELFTL